MKILILTDRLGFGGAETHIAQLAQALKRCGMEVLVASLGGTTADLLETQGIPQIRLPLCTHSPIQWLILRYKIKALIKREHIQIAHAHARIPALLIHGVRKLGCGEIVTVHAKFRSGFFRRLLSRWGEHSIAVSEDLRAYLHNVYQIPMQRITVIPNGIDLSRFSANEKDEATGAVRILFASRLDADCSRGAELLCEIAPTLVQHISNLSVTIAGGGTKLPEIAERAAQINNRLGSSCISVLGAVQDMPSLLKKQDVFVGVSRAALEAVACECPVILCGNEGYGGVLSEETFLQASLSNFCARGQKKPSAEELLRDILKLASSSALREKHANACRRLLEKWYDSSSVCEQTLDVYRKSLHTPPRATVVIGGYFGCGNLGDDAILQAFIEYTHKHYPDIRIFALTKHPSLDKFRFGVKCFNRKNPLSFLSAFLRSDVFLCGGGSLLQNATGKLSLYYYLGILQLAKACGALPVLFASGIGPLHGKRAQIATRKVLSQIPYISLRDEDSLRFLREQSIDAARLHLGADAALLLPPPSISRTYSLLKRIDVVQNRPYVCVSFKSGKATSDSRRILAAALRIFCRKEDLLPVFLPLDRGDISVNAEAAHCLGGKLFLADEASDITAILRGARLLVSMRLHGMILATTVSTPAVGIPTANDKKISSFARLAAQEFLLPAELSVVSVVDACDKMHTYRASLCPLIADAYQDLQKNAQKDLANIAHMVYNKGRYEMKSEDTL